MGETLEVRTLGGLSIQHRGEPVTGFDSRKVPALLVYLACTRRDHPREVLAELFWEDRTQAQALSNLRVALTSLRQTVEPFVTITRESVGLNPDATAWLDAAEFEEQLGAAGTDAARLTSALDLYRGDFLAGFFVDSAAFEAWATRERERLRLRAMAGLDALLAAHLSSEAYPAGIAAATRLLDMDPLREETHRQLMDLLARSGQRGKALEQYETCRRLLDDELGVAPAPETTALYERIRAGEPLAAPIPQVAEPEPEPSTPASPVTNPYKGLRAFQEADAPDFFGREALTERLLGRLTEDAPFGRFLAVVGPSGCGKSSAVRAGLIPALRRGALPGSEGWPVLQVLPGAHPFDELDIALARLAGDPSIRLLDELRRDTRGLLRAARRVLPEDAADLLLVIDQFEEVFTLVTDPAEAKFLLDSLYAAVTEPRSPLRLVITLRADFYDRPLMYPDFSEMVRQRTEAVVPLTTHELERAICGPAERVGLSLESGLATTIVSDVSEQPGALPLLQYALTELFDGRDDHTLTLATYRDIGGALGALARRADAVFGMLGSEAQTAARQVCLRLVTLGEGTEDIRRRALQDELRAAGGEATQTVLDAFDRARLVTFDQDPATGAATVELAHEAIIREWARLRAWLDASRDDVRQQRLLAAAAQEWQSAGRDRSYLLTGSRLAQFEGWATQTDLALTPDERAFLDASVTEHRRQRARRRLVRNAVVTVTAAVAVVMTVLALFAFSQRNEAQDARATSEANLAEARDLALVNGAQAALAQGDLDTALALAIVANQTQRPSAQAQMMLSQAAYTPGTIRQYDVHVQTIIEVSLAPDGRTALSAAWGDGITMWDVETGEVIHRLSDFQDGWNYATFSPDGRLVMSIAGNTNTAEVTIALWDAETGRLVRHLDTDRILPNLAISPGSFSPDGRWYVASNGGGYPLGEPLADAELIIWDVSTGQVARTLTGYDTGINGVVFSPDGQEILSVMKNHVLTLADAETGAILQQFGESQDPQTTGWHQKILFSPDGSTVLTARSDGLMILWDLTTYQEIRRFDIGSNVIAGNAALSADGETVAVASSDRGVTLWNVTTGQLLGTWPTMTTSVALRPDGHTVLAGLAFGAVRLVDMQYGALNNRIALQERQPKVYIFDVSPDESTFLACVDLDSTLGREICQVSLFDVLSGAEIQRIGPDNTDVGKAKFSPDGHRIASTHISRDRTFWASVWDVKTGQELGHFESDIMLGTVTFSPDGNLLMLGETSWSSGVSILWNLTSNQEVYRLDGHARGINEIAFAPDGRTVLTVGQDGVVILWDVGTGQEIRRFEHPAATNSAVLSPDGRRLLTTADDGLVRLWDVDTGVELRLFVGHSIAPYDAHFSPDGHTLFSSSETEVIQWDLATGAAIRRYPLGSTWNIVLSRDGRGLFLLSGEPDSAFYQLRVDTSDELLAWVQENRYVREFTCEERALYRIEPLCE